MKIIAKTFQGLEQVCADEIKAIGGSKIEKVTRAVIFDGSRYTLYAANLLLRTALRIIVPIAESNIKNETHLYYDVYNIEWEKYFSVDQTFAITATVSSPIFRHSKYAALKSKDAIVDRFRKLYKKRPNIDVDNPDFLINIHIRQNILTISLDSSGDSLHKRGYRIKTVPAPLNEVLAAGLILLSGWKPNQTLLDPMCGSGTILAEAYLMAKGLPPQKISRDFAFKKWKDFDEKIWSLMLEKEIPKLSEEQGLIAGSDISPEAVEASLANLHEIDAENNIEIKAIDFFKLSPPSSTGVIIVNPPYDKRLQEDDINNFYKEIGDKLKTDFQGWSAYIFSGNIDAIKRVGLKPSQRYSLMNGAIPAKFYKFDMYAGSKS